MFGCHVDACFVVVVRRGDFHKDLVFRMFGCCVVVCFVVVVRRGNWRGRGGRLPPSQMRPARCATPYCACANPLCEVHNIVLRGSQHRCAGCTTSSCAFAKPLCEGRNIVLRGAQTRCAGSQHRVARVANPLCEGTFGRPDRERGRGTRDEMGVSAVCPAGAECE